MIGRFPDINLDDYAYDLSEDRIAKYPLEKRSESKLLRVDAVAGEIRHEKFADLSEFVPSDSLIVRNSTKVIPARLFFKKETGGSVELLPTDPIEPSRDPQVAMSSKGECSWICVVGGKRVREGAVLEAISDKTELQVKIHKRFENKAIAAFSYDRFLSFAEVLDRIGSVPLPPYLKRDAESRDKETYQTVYAKENGSVAAPTAGLHFDESIENDLKKKNIEFCDLILHVGPGTFAPISGNVADHDMHKERVSIDANSILQILDNIRSYRPITAVGTTSARTLETLYWSGLKIARNQIELSEENGIILDQAEPYELERYQIPPSFAFEAILEEMDAKKIERLNGYTKLFIAPGYKFKTIDAMITNFHMPKSTLILLVAAFLGKDLWRKSYESALENDYRFLSYGDSSLLSKY